MSGQKKFPRVKGREDVRWALCNQSECSNKPWSFPATAFAFPFEALECEMSACEESKYESSRGSSMRRARSEGDEDTECGRRKLVGVRKGWTIS